MSLQCTRCSVLSCRCTWIPKLLAEACCMCKHKANGWHASMCYFMSMILQVLLFCSASIICEGEGARIVVSALSKDRAHHNPNADLRIMASSAATSTSDSTQQWHPDELACQR